MTPPRILTANDLSRYALDYARLRRRQTTGAVSEDELRGIYGFGDFLVLMTQAHGEECPACPPTGAPTWQEQIDDAESVSFFEGKNREAGKESRSRGATP